MVTVREAATVMLVKDLPDLHVFMLRRNPNSVFSPGAFVFPGGAVDDSDRDPLVFAAATGLDDDRASMLVGQPSHGLRYWIAAARECFEEAGFVLGDAPPEFGEHRDALNAGTAEWNTIVSDHGVRLHLDELSVFAHWLTPEGSPRRYDTWFFVARAPDDQVGAHDDSEAVASEWVRPVDALARARAGAIDLILPTMRTLVALAKFETTTALLDAVRAAQTDGVPHVVDDGSGQRIRLPHDERARTQRGWRALEPSLAHDLALEREFYATPGEGAA